MKRDDRDKITESYRSRTNGNAEGVIRKESITPSVYYKEKMLY